MIQRLKPILEWSLTFVASVYAPKFVYHEVHTFGKQMYTLVCILLARDNTGLVSRFGRVVYNIQHVVYVVYNTENICINQSKQFLIRQQISRSEP